MRTLLVVDQIQDWSLQVAGLEVVSSTDYLTKADYQTESPCRVFNLCRSYAYQTAGYYVSLLATARSQKPIPTLTTILEMKSQALLKIRSHDLDELIQRSLKDIKTDDFELSIYFGRNLARRYDRLATELYRCFNAPLMRAKFVKKEKWRIAQVNPIALKDVPESHFSALGELASEYFTKRAKPSSSRKTRFSMAILVNPEEALPPSNERALQKFIKAAAKVHIDAEVITKDDYGRLAEFDGLFIRETTAVNHHTYRFAQKAQALGMEVIDDPESILRCTNKVFLAELFKRYHLPAPTTTLVHRENFDEIVPDIALPAVLKEPDSAFSKGVIKVETTAELRDNLIRMLEDSDLVIVQEFLKTDFDWRIGVLDGKPLYACKYHMARNHWQVYKQNNKGGDPAYGKSDTYYIEAVPKPLLNLAIKACSHIGKGLYGLDIKEKDGKFYIIEINDNPSIDAGTEDKLLKDALYEIIMNVFLDRMETRARGR